MPVHIAQGSRSEVAFVLSCPGQHEEIAGHPAAGMTGKNLDQLIEFLRSDNRLGDLSRSHITITNAWPSIEYRARTGRSEARDSEILSAANMERLASELNGITMLIVFCGKKAGIACKRLHETSDLPETAMVCTIPHLGTRGLNAIKLESPLPSIGDASIGMTSTYRRLQVIAYQLLKRLSEF